MKVPKNALNKLWGVTNAEATQAAMKQMEREAKAREIEFERRRQELMAEIAAAAKAASPPHPSVTYGSFPISSATSFSGFGLSSGIPTPPWVPTPPGGYVALGTEYDDVTQPPQKPVEPPKPDARVEALTAEVDTLSRSLRDLWTFIEEVGLMPEAVAWCDAHGASVTT